MNKNINSYFYRTEYAKELTAELFNSVSGLFISGAAGTGKSSFIKKDLIPEIENSGAVAVYLDLKDYKNKFASINDAIQFAISNRQQQILTATSFIKYIKSKIIKK